MADKAISKRLKIDDEHDEVQLFTTDGRRQEAHYRQVVAQIRSASEMSCPSREGLQPLQLSAYIKAGYTPICGCRLDTALDYVLRALFPQRAHFETDGYIQYNTETSAIEINVGDLDMPMYANSGYYWESDTLFKTGG